MTALAGAPTASPLKCCVSVKVPDPRFSLKLAVPTRRSVSSSLSTTVSCWEKLKFSLGVMTVCLRTVLPSGSVNATVLTKAPSAPAVAGAEARTITAIRSARLIEILPTGPAPRPDPPTYSGRVPLIRQSGVLPRAKAACSRLRRSSAEQATIIALDHAPLRTGIPEADAIGLSDAERGAFGESLPPAHQC